VLSCFCVCDAYGSTENLAYSSGSNHTGRGDAGCGEHHRQHPQVQRVGTQVAENQLVYTDYD
jgi:hypothetical protein